MARTLTGRVEAQLEALVLERQRILRQATADVDAVDVKIAALTAAKATLTPDVERSYAQLTAMGLLKEL